MNFNIRRTDTNVPYMHKLTIQFYLEEVTHVVGIKEERGKEQQWKGWVGLQHRQEKIKAWKVSLLNILQYSVISSRIYQHEMK